MQSIQELVDLYGSDKNLSGYTHYYQGLFSPHKNNVKTVLEIGIGTLDSSQPSTFSGNKNLFPQYTPGGSLRAWRDFFPHATIYGLDVAEDCNIAEERIRTNIFSSLDTISCNTHYKDNSFDIIVDDGLHTAIGQLLTLQNMFRKVKDGGYYCIEDCGGGGDGVNIFEEFEKNFKKIADEHEYFFGGNFIVIRKTGSKKGQITSFDEFCEMAVHVPLEVTPNLTVVTGLWNINRVQRGFDSYIENFKKFLDIPANLYIYLPKELEHLVWENPHRTKKNTVIHPFELDRFKDNLYTPFWDKTQEIRTDPEWYGQLGDGGWLQESPQALNEWYNPLVQSKMFLLHDAKVSNRFDTDYFIWLDAGITHTVYEKQFTDDRALDHIIPYLETFLFLSFPYEAPTEIHGFKYDAMNKFAKQKVKYVCRGGLFGGHKDYISEANATYYSTLDSTLKLGYMGTEESIFTIMSYVEPHIYRRYELDANGLIVKFTNALSTNTVTLAPTGPRNHVLPVGRYDRKKDKTSLYVLGFNFPQQFQTLIDSFQENPEWMVHPRKILINNSTDDDAIKKYDEMCHKYGFEHIITGKNTGICGGRQLAATHFHESDSKYYFFFEDDMCLHTPETAGVCRNGFQKYTHGLYHIVHEIMAKEAFDFLKLSYTEVYMDNNIQVSWYNVPQKIRSQFWPEYDQLPLTGLDPYAPRTNFKNINAHKGVSYASGEIYYANWPMIVSREGNYKMFIETSWEHPFEQTWMSHMFQETVAGNIRPAVLLASPINHNRIMYYDGEDRREN